LLQSDRVACTVLVGSVTAMALSSHAVFSVTVGQFAFFKGAYDEDTYFLFALLRSAVGLDRLLSTEITRGLYELSGCSSNLTMVALGALLPASAALAAFFLATELTGGCARRILCTVLLLFGQDLFSLGNVAVWTASQPSLAWFTGLFGPLGPRLVPPYETSYLTLFRLPEPPLSLALCFILLIFLVRLARRQGFGPASHIILSLLILIMPAAYVFVGLPLLLVTGAFAAILVSVGRARDGLWVGIVTLIALLIFGLSMISGRTGGGDLVFASRLPVITPAVLASLVATTSFFAWCIVRRTVSTEAALAMILLAMPAMICNQQIVTGVMVSARDWERNINYPLLVAGVFIAGRVIGVSWRWSDLRSGALAWVSVILCAIVLVRAQFLNYSYFVDGNLVSLAMARAVKSMSEAADPVLLLDEPGLSPLLAVRLNGRARFVIDYTEIFLNRIPALDISVRHPANSYEAHLFEYWQRTGVTPDEAERILKMEVQQEAGYFLAFLFAIPDYWYPATDRRHVRQAEIAHMIPEVAARYRAYLTRPPQSAAAANVIRLTTQPPDLLQSAPGYVESLVSSARAGKVEVFAYRQVLR
jgi:hypothetical protein